MYGLLLLLPFLPVCPQVLEVFLAFFTKTTNTKFLSVSLGFSAGVMIYVSMVEIFFKAKEYGEHHLSIYGLILGMIVMAVSLLLFI
jgi:ZIP family zinc transporter